MQPNWSRIRLRCLKLSRCRRSTSGEIAGTIGGIEHLVDGVSALAAALGGRNIAMAVFETDSADHPLSITARADASEEPVIAIGIEAFTLPPPPVPGA